MIRRGVIPNYENGKGEDSAEIFNEISITQRGDLEGRTVVRRDGQRDL